ncbi:hypothetical protein NKDENANG_02310 [Candidatus Entotheonellaceae bacterium PAL068K]
MQRILVIRSGAIGDFILTLPAVGALRQACPRAYIEVLGHPHRAILARHPVYADHISDLEGWDWYRLFSPQARVSESLAAYLRSFEAIFAYLPGSGEICATRLRQYCSGYVVHWPPQLLAGRHAAEHLLQPVCDYRPQSYDPTPRVYVTAEAHDAAQRFWQQAALPSTGVIALHPGSGGAHKLWPLAGWQRVMAWAAQQEIPCLVLSGPAEHERVRQLFQTFNNLPPWPCAEQMPLLHLAALMARCQLVLGHDSGMMHLAAAVGTTTLALFGPTDPYTWGPRHARTCVLQPDCPGPLTLHNLPPGIVIETLQALQRETFTFVPSSVACTIRRVAKTSRPRHESG